MEYVKRWLVLVLACAAFFGLGYMQGKSDQIAQHLEQMVEEQKVVMSIYKKSNDIATKEAEVVTKEVVKYKTVYKDVVKEVIKYEQTEVGSNPILDPDFGLLYNASALACSPAEPSCRADAAVSGPIAPGEVLRASSEAHQLYQECRVTVEGWQRLYMKLKEQRDENHN